MVRGRQVNAKGWSTSENHIFMQISLCSECIQYYLSLFSGNWSLYFGKDFLSLFMTWFAFSWSHSIIFPIRHTLHKLFTSVLSFFDRDVIRRSIMTFSKNTYFFMLICYGIIMWWMESETVFIKLGSGIKNIQLVS